MKEEFPLILMIHLDFMMRNVWQIHYSGLQKIKQVLILRARNEEELLKKMDIPYNKENV